MTMAKISLDKAQKIATKAKLKPCRVKGTEVLQFTRKGGANFEVMGWDDFATTLKGRGLSVYESGGWMKIMKN
jgi:hypothetical protein